MPPVSTEIKDEIRQYAVGNGWTAKKIHEYLMREYDDKACSYATVMKYAKLFREEANLTKPKDPKVKKETKKKTATAAAAPKTKAVKATKSGGGGQIHANAPINASPYYAYDLRQQSDEDEAETSYLVARSLAQYEY